MPGDFPLADCLNHDVDYLCIVVSCPIWLIPLSDIAAPESAGIVDVAGGVDDSVELCSAFCPQPITARAMVSDRTATIARAKIFRIFTIHLLSDLPRPKLPDAARV